MLYKKIQILILLLIASVLYGCAGLDLTGNKAEWEKLQDRKFYFTEFQYLLVDSNKKEAFKAMSQFPMKKIMYILASEYNIEIDLSDYYRFIRNEYSSEIKTEGFFRNEKFTWKTEKNISANRIKIIYEKDYFEKNKMKFSLYITSGDKTMKSLSIDYTQNDYLFTQLGFYFSKTEMSIKDFDKNGYDDKNTIPGLNLGDPALINKPKSSRAEEIKVMLDEYVKTLDEDQKKSFKHEMIDHIYKICE